MYFQVKNLQVDNCILKNGLDLGSNLFPYFNFWIHIPGRNRVRLGIRCTFTLTMSKPIADFQKETRSG